MLFQKDKDHYFLITVNNSNERQNVRVWLEASLFAKSVWHVNDLFSKQSENINFSETPFAIANINRKDGTILELVRLES